MHATWVACLSRPRGGGGIELASDDWEDASEGYKGKGKRLRHKTSGKYRYVYDSQGRGRMVKKPPASGLPGRRKSAPQKKQEEAPRKRTWAEWFEQTGESILDGIGDIGETLFPLDDGSDEPDEEATPGPEAQRRAEEVARKRREAARKGQATRAANRAAGRKPAPRAQRRRVGREEAVAAFLGQVTSPAARRGRLEAALYARPELVEAVAQATGYDGPALSGGPEDVNEVMEHLMRWRRSRQGG